MPAAARCSYRGRTSTGHQSQEQQDEPVLRGLIKAGLQPSARAWPREGERGDGNRGELRADTWVWAPQDFHGERSWAWEMPAHLELEVSLLPASHVGFPGGLDGKETSCSVGDLGLIPGPGRGNGNPLQYSCLENSMDGGAWWTTVHRVARVGHN